MFHDESWKPIYFGVKKSKINVTTCVSLQTYCIVAAAAYISYSGFLLLDAMLARYMLSSCVCLSVHLFVCLSQAGAVPKRLNVGSQTMPYDSPGTVVFCCQKSRKIPTGSPPMGAPNRGGVDSYWQFQPTSRCISETVQDRDIVTLKH